MRFLKDGVSVNVLNNMPAPKGNKYAQGNKGGRPRIVTLEELPAFGEEMIEWAREKMTTVLTEKDAKDKMPFFLQTFCRERNVSNDTIARYAEENKEFCGQVDEVKEIVKESLILGGLKGWWNPSAFTFVAKNVTDMRDKVEQDITSGGEKLTINLVDFRNGGNNPS